MAFIIIISIIFLSLNLINRKKEQKINKEKIETYLTNETDNESEEQIIGILKIPTINLERGFYSYYSKQNDVNKNIQVIEDNMSDMLILAAHRGNSKVSFFKDLDKLSMGDEIYLDYKHNIYKYRLYYKYYENKDGNLSIKYDNTKKVLVLITCVKELKNKQVVYIAYKI